MLRENSDRVSAADRQAVEAKVEALKSVMKGDDARAIRSAMEDLQQESYRLSEGMYQQAGGDNGNGHSSAQPQPEDVVDGEFRSV